MDPATIRDQIDRILHSQSLASKSQLRKLLEILFKNMDSQSALKPDKVIKELWPGEIKTKRAADVVTEMNRLRRALETYYSREGKTGPITICLPNRSPHARNGLQEKPWIVARPRGEGEDHRPWLQEKPRRGLKTIGAIAALCAAVGVAAYVATRMLRVHDQPQFGRLDGAMLIITNAEGKELWRKFFPDGLGRNRKRSLRLHASPQNASAN